MDTHGSGIETLAGKKRRTNEINYQENDSEDEDEDERMARKVSKLFHGPIVHPAAAEAVAEVYEEGHGVCCEVVDKGIYCHCHGLANDDMIECEGSNCKGGNWFHYDCVGLTVATIPSTVWYCEPCQQGVSTMRAHFGEMLVPAPEPSEEEDEGAMVAAATAAVVAAAAVAVAVVVAADAPVAAVTAAEGPKPSQKRKQPL